MLSQLSYTPASTLTPLTLVPIRNSKRFVMFPFPKNAGIFGNPEFIKFPMGLSGLEPPTSRLSGVRSNQLSYKPVGSRSHLLSRSVSRQVPSAVPVLTVVFGMGTGVSPARIATRNVNLSTVRAATAHLHYALKCYVHERSRSYTHPCIFKDMNASIQSFQCSSDCTHLINQTAMQRPYSFFP